MNLNEPRIRYAVDVLSELFPGATVEPATGRPARDDRFFAFAPSVNRPRLLVPTTPRGAAAAALRTYGGRMTRTAQLSYSAAASGLAVAGTAPLRARLAVRTRDGHRVMGIDDHLSDVVHRPVAVAFHLTPARANRKPIVQLLAHREKHPIGFAKVGVNELTARLVQREAVALQAVATRPVGRMVVPSVLGHGEFAGFDVLTLAALPTWQAGRTPSLTEAVGAAAEISALRPMTRQPLASSEYWQRIRSQIARFSSDDRGRQLAACIERVTEVVGSTEVAFTASHGDFTPWNMWATTDNKLLVWDWERYEAATPAGLDLLHFWLNDQFVRSDRSGSGLGERLISRANEILAPLSDVDDPQLAAALYLVHLGVRYEVDRQADAGAVLGRIESWLLPAVTAWLADPALTKRT